MRPRRFDDNAFTDSPLDISFCPKKADLDGDTIRGGMIAASNYELAQVCRCFRTARGSGKRSPALRGLTCELP
jgi:hypothetical protein